MRKRKSNKKVKQMIADQCSHLMKLKFEWIGNKLFFHTKKTKYWPSRIVDLKHFGGHYSITANQLNTNKER